MRGKKIPPGHGAAYRPAFQCFCPEPTCTGWRACVSLGGGHITHSQALRYLKMQASLQPDPEDGRRQTGRIKGRRRSQEDNRRR